MSITSPREIQQMISKQDREIADLTNRCQQLHSALMAAQRSFDDLHRDYDKRTHALELVRNYAFHPEQVDAEAFTEAERLSAAGFVACAALGVKEE